MRAKTSTTAPYRCVEPAAAPCLPAQADAALHEEALAVAVMKKWRLVHMPLTSVFGVLVLLHVISVLMFWSW